MYIQNYFKILVKDILDQSPGSKDAKRSVDLLVSWLLFACQRPIVPIVASHFVTIAIDVII